MCRRCVGAWGVWEACGTRMECVGGLGEGCRRRVGCVGGVWGV